MIRGLSFWFGQRSTVERLLLTWVATVLGALVLIASVFVPVAVRERDTDAPVFHYGLIAAGAITLCAGIVGNRLAAKWDRAAALRLPTAREFFANHDLSKLVGLSLGMICRSVSESLKSSGERSTINAIAKRFEKEWTALAQTESVRKWNAGISDRELLTYVRNIATPALEHDRWVGLIRAMTVDGNLAVAPDSLRKLTTALTHRFGEALRQALKRDFVLNGEASMGLFLDISRDLLNASSGIESTDPGNQAALDMAKAELEKQYASIALKMDRYHVELRSDVAMAAQSLDRIEGKLDTIGNDVKLIVDRLMGMVSEKDQQIGLLRSRLQDSVRRLAEAGQSGDMSAQDKLDQLRGGGDPKLLGAFLDERIAKESQATIELLRERAAVAYVTGEIARAEQCLGGILAVRPDDLDATNRLGLVYQLRGDLPAAEAQYNRVLRLAADDEGWKADALGNHGNIALTRGDLDAAEALYNEALEINRRRNNLDGLARTFGKLGLVAQARGDLDRSENLLNQALEISRKLGSHEEQAVNLFNLGTIAHARGDLDSAEKLYSQSLEINRKLGRTKGQAAIFGNLGLIARTRGDLAGAEKLHMQSLEISLMLDDLEGQAIQLGNLSLIAQTGGNLEGAEALLNQALEVNRKLGSVAGQASNLGNLGNIREIRGDLDGAQKLCNQALEMYRNLGHLEGQAANLGNIGNIALTRGDLDGAEKLHSQSLEIYCRLGRAVGQANQLGNLGFIAEVRGDMDAAEKLYNQAKEIYRKLGHLEGHAASLSSLGNIAAQREDFDEARALWMQSRDLFVKLGDKSQVEQLQGLLGGLPTE